MLHERIKNLRKALDLTQQEFADRLNIKRGTMANYEIGRNVPIDAVVSLICREFHVNEKWLRTGKGEMFIPSANGVLDELAQKYRLSDRSKIIVARFLDLKPDIQEAVADYIEEIAVAFSDAGSTIPAPAAGKDICAPPAPGASIQEKTEAELEAEADAFAAIAREQFLAEFKRESPISSARESDVG